MSEQKHCSVVGCRLQHRALHTLPASEELRLQWIRFIYDGKVPVRVGKKPIVCANHFLSDCFQNLGQYNAGLAGRLLLKEGSIPTVRGQTAQLTASTSGLMAVVKHVACQTDPPTTRTAGTQLSMKTLQPHFRSTGTQKSVSCTDVGVGTSAVASSASLPFPTSIKSQRKRRRLELEEEKEEEEEEEKPLNGSSVDTEEPHDSADTWSESADVTVKSSTAVRKTQAVYESCLMELFEECPVCQRECDVRTRRSGTFLSVEQRCLHCEFCRKWNSRPPAGNLQLPTALL